MKCTRRHCVQHVYLTGGPGRAGLVLDVNNIVATRVLLGRLNGAHPPNVVTRSNGAHIANLHSRSSHEMHSF